MRRPLILPVLLLATPLLCGCGSRGGLASVRGEVTYRGQPVAGATVVFMRAAPGLLPASGMTDASGRYELMTTAPGDGVQPGKYLVTITARGPDKSPPGDP